MLEQISPLPKTHETTIPGDYLDAMGHMNVMWYTHLFAKGMGGLFLRIGLDRAYMEQHNAGTFALESHFRYLAEVRVGHGIAIHSRIVGRSAKRFHVMHFMINRDQANLAATAETVGTHVDLKVRRSSPLPDFVCERIDALLDEHSRLDWEPPLCGTMST